jgi:Nucleoside-diphosphate-sugar epimerases
MTILITGATGLVGSRLLPRLIEAGYDCKALIRKGKEAPEGASVVFGELLDKESLLLATRNIDTVIHLAAVLRTQNPEEIWKANLEGTRNLLDAVRENSPQARFIIASTGLVYNLDSVAPALESDDVDPQRDYPASKVASEKLLRDSGLNWSILRFGFVYGENDGHISQLPHIANLLGLHPANRLSMIHHRDIAKLFKMGLEGKLDNMIINAVDDAPMSIYELISIAGEHMAPSSTALEHPWSGVMDGSLSRSLGFKPDVATTWQAFQAGVI